MFKDLDAMLRAEARTPWRSVSKNHGQLRGLLPHFFGGRKKINRTKVLNNSNLTLFLLIFQMGCEEKETS